MKAFKTILPFLLGIPGIIHAMDNTIPQPSLDVTHPVLSSLQLTPGTLNERGSLVLDFRLDGPGTLGAEPRLGRMLSGRLFELPFLRANLFVSRRESGANERTGLNLIVPTVEGGTKFNQLVLSRLEGDHPYQLVLNWDAPEDTLTAFLQGVIQGDMTHWAEETPAIRFQTEGDLILDGRIEHEGTPSFNFHFSRVRIFPAPLTPDEVATLAREEALPPMNGEGRTIYTEALDLGDRSRQLLFEESFESEITWIHEEDLLDETGQRKALPEERWILEGPRSQLETTSGGLRMWTEDPADRQNGHWVLWLNQEFPDGILVEYEFAPKTTGKGLHILFLAAHNPNGDSLFDLDLVARRGVFRPYIIGGLNSYHVSPWAADDQSLRRTANMRKNDGFSLVAVGNDLIGGGPEGFHRIRALIKDGRVEVESNGVLSIRFQDNGIYHGPVWNQGGLIGFRFMAHTGEAVIRNLRVYQIDAGQQP